MVNVRRVQAWIWWLLPFLVARAMLPVGFMPTVGTHGIQLQLCSVGAQHIGDDHGQSTSDPRHSDLSCPFAHAPGAAPIAHQSLNFAAPATSLAEIAARDQTFISCGPPRLHRVRGPPVLV